MVRDYLEAMGGCKEKLLVGVSLKFGGYEWRCRTDQPLEPIVDKGTWRPLEECEAKSREHGARWDDQQKSSWYCYPDGGAFVQGRFNDAHAWQAKLDWIGEQQLGGIGIWVVDGANDPFIISEPQREADIGLLQNLFFHELHQESDHIPSGDGIESVEVAKIFSLDDRWDICVFAMRAKTPYSLVVPCPDPA